MSDENNDFSMDALYQEARSLEDSSDETQSQAFLSLCEDREKYIYKEEIGHGGMKIVSRVYDTFIRRDVALATLKPNLSKQLYDNFIYEAWLTAQLDHPNIIKIYDLGITKEQTPFFTMDLKTGATLEEVLKQDKLSINEKLEIFIKICDAISYAHSKSILHLDLKPENIQIGEFGEVIVCDWGLGKIQPGANFSDKRDDFDDIFLNAELILQTDSEHTGGRGTPGFMAPEQVKFGTKKTKQTDIYGLGALLYYILTLRKPVGGSVERIFQRTLDGKLAPLPNQMSESLSAVIHKAMSTQPTKRYPTVKSLRTDVHNYLMGFSTSAENAGFIREAMLFFHRNRTICLTLLVFSTILIAGSIWFIYKLDISRREALTAKNEAVSAQNEARENLTMAQSSMKELKKTLKLYEDEKNAYKKLMENYEKVFYEPKNYWDRRKFFSKPYEDVKATLEKVNVILSRNPNDKRALFEKSQLLFISGNYSMAAEVIQKHKITGLECIPAVVNHLKLHYEKRRNIWEFIKIVDFFIERGRKKYPSEQERLILSKLVTYDHATRQDKRDYITVVKKLLIYLNPNWNSDQLKYDWKAQKLTLRGKGLKHIAMMLIYDADDSSILRFIPLKSLDISHTSFHDAREFSTLNLKALNVSHTRVDSLKVIRRFPDLKNITIHRGQFSKEHLKQLSKHIKVIVVE